MSKSKGRSSLQKRCLKIKIAKGRTQVRCCFCRKPIPIDNATLEHVLPLAFGGSWNERNLTLSCRECNADRGVADFELYRAWRRGYTFQRPPTTLEDLSNEFGIERLEPHNQDKAQNGNYIF